MVSRSKQPPLVFAVRSELAAARKLNSALGQQAMILAERMAEGGGAMAALSRELREVMHAALGRASKIADPIDELKTRRDTKRNAG